MAGKRDINNVLTHWYSLRIKLLLEGIVIGLFTGIIVVLFRFLIEETGGVLDKVYKSIILKHWIVVCWILLFMVIGYIVGTMIKRDPMISGSGIPQVEGILMRKLDMKWWKVIIGKFIGGVLAIGAGLSLGREGPSVQLGAAVGQGFSRIFKRIKIEEKFLITSGASAGLSAAFNAPLAGTLFALEEVHKNFSPVILVSALSSALASDFVSSEFFGLKPVFQFNNISAIPLKYYLYIIVLGVIIGITGVIFNKVLLKTQSLYTKQKLIPKEFRPIIPLLVSIVFGLMLPQVLGGGNKLITSLTYGNMSMKIIIIILIAKFFFTMICYGSGVPGGIFLPMLAIGALIGNVYGGILAHFFNFNNMYINNFIILAMAGYFTAIVKSPITGIILITEMTASFSHLLSVSIVSIVAFIVADMMGSKPIYESLLERFINSNDPKELEHGREKSIIQMAVCMGSFLDGKEIKEVIWPKACLVVGIRRGDTEIIPKGDTAINAGDYINILTDEDKVSKVTEELCEMTNCIEKNCKYEKTN